MLVNVIIFMLMAMNDGNVSKDFHKSFWKGRESSTVYSLIGLFMLLIEQKA